jgi:hypothetical protein
MRLQPEALMGRDNNWADILDQALEYLVIRKANRLQVLVRPTPKQVRRRGKRAWSVVASITAANAAEPNASQDELREAVLQTLSEMAANLQEEAQQTKTKKKKTKKAKSQS